LDRLSAPLISPETAWERICRVARPLPSERVALEQALGRYLARPVRADRDFPATRRAAMDGYALRAADAPGTPAIVGEIAAGAPPRPNPRPGQCVRIFTGAPVPEGADAVVPIEETEPAGDGRVRVPEARPNQHILRQSEFARRGDILLPAGARLTPEALAVCAAAGCARPPVHRRPRAAAIATGSELRPVDARPRPYEIRDSNSALIRAALQAEGCAPVFGIRLKDDRAAIRRRIAALAARCDLLALSGGVSVGDYDWVPDALAELGARVHYHGVAMKPGKPQLFAVLGRCLVFGLPGNPLSAAVGLREFLLPAARLLAGCPAERARPEWRLPLGEPLRVRGPRQRFVPARLAPRDGATVLLPLAVTASADAMAAARADGAIVAPMGAEALDAGTVVAFRPWSLP